MLFYFCSQAEGRCHWIVYCESQGKVTHLCFLNIYLLKGRIKKMLLKIHAWILWLKGGPRFLLVHTVPVLKVFFQPSHYGSSNRGWNLAARGHGLPRDGSNPGITELKKIWNLRDIWLCLHASLLFGVPYHLQMVVAVSPWRSESSDVVCSRAGRSCGKTWPWRGELIF